MFDKPTAVNTMGLELGSSYIRAALLSFQKNQPKLESFFEIPLSAAPTTANVNALYLLLLALVMEQKQDADWA